MSKKTKRRCDICHAVDVSEEDKFSRRKWLEVGSKDVCPRCLMVVVRAYIEDLIDEILRAHNASHR